MSHKTRKPWPWFGRKFDEFVRSLADRLAPDDRDEVAICSWD